MKEQSRFPIFQERFREMQGSTSDVEFGQFLNISRQTVGFYGNGQRVPDALALKSIAEKCDVSADYLLGLSDARTTDATIQGVCHFTGLSEKAIKSLAIMKDSGEFPSLHMIEEIIALYDREWRNA